MFSFSEGTDVSLPDVYTHRDGSAYDLTGVTVNIKVWSQPREGDADPVLTTTATLTDAVNGAVTIDISDGDLAAGQYIYEAYATTTLLARGEIHVFPSFALG